MHKRYSMLIALLITILLVTACGAKQDKSPVVTNTREYVLKAFSIPEAFKANSSVNWTNNEANNSSGTLTVDLVVPDASSIDANSLVQDFLKQALAINKEGKATIEKLDIQIKDANQNSLVIANYVFNGQDFVVAAQDPNLPYPVQQYIPPVAPTAYP